jgi:Acetylornithine deacetylase/Succinyl-diaminopimelate desuccinylase and related deacylases
VTLNSTTKGFFGELAKVWPAANVAEAMRDVVSSDPATSDKGAQVLSRIPVFDAVMRNGVSPVALGGGVAGNVIPAEVTATLNVRTIPGHRIEDVVDRLRQAIGSDTVTIEIASHGEEAPGSDPGAVMFEAIAASAKQIDPDLAVVPYLSTGGTDSAHLRRLGINAYGILPFPMEQSDEERMHGHDERVPVQSLHFGTRLIFESVRHVAES